MIAKRLRKAVLQAAMEGKLTKQLDNDSSVYQLISEVHKIDNDDLWEIPKKWVWVKFGDLVDFKMGKTPERANPIYWGNDVPWISIADMNNQSFIMETKEKVSNSALESIFKEQISPKGTLIMSFKLTVGRTSILGIDALHNEAIISIFPKKEPDIQKTYLYFVLPEIANMGETKDAIKGKTLNSKSIYNLLIPLPPIEEQKRIVEKLEVLLAEIDKLEQEEKALKELEDKFPERLKKAILKAAFVGKLTEQSKAEKPIMLSKNLILSKNEICNDNAIPDNWLLTSFETVFKTIPTKKYQVLTSQILDSGKYPVISQSKNYIDGYYNNIDKLFKVSKPVLLFGDHTRVIKYIDNNFIVGADGTKILETSYVLEKFGYYYLSYLVSKMDVRNYGRHFKILSKNNVVLPPIEEQKRIVNKLDELLKIGLLNSSF